MKGTTPSSAAPRSAESPSAAFARTLVVGLGVSGRAVCELLCLRGVEVTGTDLAPEATLRNLLVPLESLGCRFHLGSHREEDFLSVDQIVVSPGVPLGLPPLQAAAERGIEIVGEMEWAWRQTDVPTVAVTGTNGKTTTTHLVGELLRASGKRVFVGGNIGVPLTRWLLDRERRARSEENFETVPGIDAELLVLEVSSFQLDTARTFAPDIAVLLNVTEDHLDRYESFAHYADSKFSIFSRQSKNQVGILNGDDPVCREGIDRVPGRRFIFSRKDPRADAFVRDRRVRISLPGRDSFCLDLSACPLQGIHNEENILAAALAAACAGGSPAAMQDRLNNVRPMPHRMESVRMWRGVEFVNDSKGTNVGAVVKALENFHRPVWLLMGGRDKLGSYEPLRRPMEAKVRGVLAFGEAGPRIAKAVGNWVAAAVYEGLEEAFKAAAAGAKPGDVVLLSPACSSFDQYRSYGERGDHFKALVWALPDESEGSGIAGDGPPAGAACCQDSPRSGANGLRGV